MKLQLVSSLSHGLSDRIQTPRLLRLSRLWPGDQEHVHSARMHGEIISATSPIERKSEPQSYLGLDCVSTLTVLSCYAARMTQVRFLCVSAEELQTPTRTTIGVIEEAHTLGRNKYIFVCPSVMDSFVSLLSSLLLP